MAVSAICFHYDARWRDLWEQLVRTYGVGAVHELGVPDDVDPAPWIRADAVPGPRVVFSPADAKYMPGTTALHDFDHRDDLVYCFGSDDQNNPMIDSEACVYIPMPRVSHPLWSVQAAAIVLHDAWRRSGDP